MRVFANIFGWIGFFVLLGGAISLLAALLPLIPIVLVGMIFFLPAVFTVKGEEQDNERE